MANKTALLGKTKIKVENMSGFDKSGYNALTAPLGALVPLRKQLLLPGNFNLSLNIGATLPPLASDAFLRTHLKVEAFVVPMRLCTASFESWFCGKPIGSYVAGTGYVESRAELPRIDVFAAIGDGVNQNSLDIVYGPHSLMDYFNVKKALSSSGNVSATYINSPTSTDAAHQYYNFFPFASYALVYDYWYRNKLIEKPLFLRPSAGEAFRGAYLPYLPVTSLYSLGVNIGNQGPLYPASTTLNNGTLLDLRYRNYGDDYFTTCLPSAQDGNPVTIDTSSGSFSIGALRLGNTMQHFEEINQLAGPDFVQMNKSRYGVDLSQGVAQNPILVGSADFPMFTSGVEQTAQAAASANPFTSVGARYGRAHAEGSDFVCDFSVSEPSYLMVISSLVPEANYAAGVSKDMRIFTQSGSLTDLPVASLEGVGFEPVYEDEVDAAEATASRVFGYQNRYMWHKAGQLNEVHGLFRRGASLASFIPQRVISIGANLNSTFLKVQPTDLDNIMAVSGSLSQYGVMIDSYIRLRVSEPLSESRLPSLADPAYEHGKDVYLTRGGIRVH